MRARAARPKPVRPSLPTAQEPAPGALPLPRFAQVKQHVSRMIVSGAWPAGHRLPSEVDLVDQLGVSRMTVNRALRELVAQGRITRVPGVGSYVAQEKPQSTLLQVGILADEIRQRGNAYRCQILALEQQVAPVGVGFLLDLLPGEVVFRTVCLHFENDSPVQFEERYVSPRMVPHLLEQDFTATTPAEFLARNVSVDQIEHVVDAVMPGKHLARRLAMSAGEPCLLLTRRTWIREHPVSVVRCWHPAARYRLGSRFRPSGNSNPA